MLGGYLCQPDRGIIQSRADKYGTSNLENARAAAKKYPFPYLTHDAAINVSGHRVYGLAGCK